MIRVGRSVQEYISLFRIDAGNRHTKLQNFRDFRNDSKIERAIFICFSTLFLKSTLT